MSSTLTVRPGNDRDARGGARSATGPALPRSQRPRTRASATTRTSPGRRARCTRSAARACPGSRWRPEAHARVDPAQATMGAGESRLQGDSKRSRSLQVHRLPGSGCSQLPTSHGCPCAAALTTKQRSGSSTGRACHWLRASRSFATRAPARLPTSRAGSGRAQRARPPGASASGRLRRSSGPGPEGAEEEQLGQGSRPPVGLVNSRNHTAAKYHGQIATRSGASGARAWPSSAGCPSTAVPARRARRRRAGRARAPDRPAHPGRPPHAPARPAVGLERERGPGLPERGRRGDPERAERLAPPRLGSGCPSRGARTGTRAPQPAGAEDEDRGLHGSVLRTRGAPHHSALRRAPGVAPSPSGRTDGSARWMLPLAPALLERDRQAVGEVRGGALVAEPGLEAPGLSDRRCLDPRHGPTARRSRARLKVPAAPSSGSGPAREASDLTRDAEDARAHQDDARRVLVTNSPNWPGGSWDAVRVRSLSASSGEPCASRRAGSPVSSGRRASSSGRRRRTRSCSRSPARRASRRSRGRS